MDYITDAPGAPKAIGPYSQAVVANGLAFLSGQIPLDPESGEIIGETAKEQTLQVMKNLSAVLSHIKISFSDVVKSTIFLSSMDDFAAVNEVYAEILGDGIRPARATVAVRELPRSVLVEIAMDAIVS